jgi:hypothetical protein
VAGSKVFVIEISFVRTTSADVDKEERLSGGRIAGGVGYDFKALHRGTSKRRLIQGRIWIGDAVLNQTRVDLGLRPADR